MLPKHQALLGHVPQSLYDPGIGSIRASHALRPLQLPPGATYPLQALAVPKSPDAATGFAVSSLQVQATQLVHVVFQ